MADEPDDQIADDAPTEPEQPDEESFDPAKARDKIRKANQEAANLRRRLKEAEAAEAKLREIEDASKSDIDKATERATQAEQRATAAERRALVLEVAADKGLTPAQAKRLVGDTREDLEADADELLATFTPADDERRTPARRPKEKLRPGAVPDADDDSETDPAKLAARVPLSQF